MPHPKLLIVFLFGAFITSCKEYSLIGNWQRLNLAMSNFDSLNNDVKTGDMTISNDSTFFIKGDSKSGNTNIPGWHVGEDIKGTWSKPDKDHIILKEDDYNFQFVYKIIKLDNSNLIIVSNLDGYYLKYKRK